MNYIKTADKHVRDILKFLKNIGFKDVNGGSDFKIGGHQLDACGVMKRLFLLLSVPLRRI